MFPILWLCSLLLLPIAQAGPKPKCIVQHLTHPMESAPDAFWERQIPVRLGETGVLTYATDVEFSVVDVFRLLQSDKQALREVENDFLKLPVDFFTDALDMDEKTFRKRAIRTGFPISRAEYRLTELNPSYLEEVFKSFAFRSLSPYSLQDHVASFAGAGAMAPGLAWGAGAKKIGHAVEALLQRRTLPVKVTHEMDGTLEVSHLSFEDVPAVYRSQISRIRGGLDNPQFHFHLGLPASEISEQKGFFISQALETRANLASLLRADPANPSKLTFHRSTLLFEADRGNVYFYPNRFDTPAKTHDVQLREWGYLDEAFEQIHLASVLATEHWRLKPWNDKLGRSNHYVGNISGALEATARILNGKDAQEMRALALKFSKVQDTAIPSPELIREAQRLITRNKLVERLRDPSLYLARD